VALVAAGGAFADMRGGVAVGLLLVGALSAGDALDAGLRAAGDVAEGAVAAAVVVGLAQVDGDRRGRLAGLDAVAVGGRVLGAGALHAGGGDDGLVLD